MQGCGGREGGRGGAVVKVPVPLRRPLSGTAPRPRPQPLTKSPVEGTASVRMGLHAALYAVSVEGRQPEKSSMEIACVVMTRLVLLPAGAAPFARRSAMKPAVSNGSSVNCADATAAAARAADGG